MVDPTPRRVGKSTLRVPSLAFGGGPLGDPRVSNEESLRAVAAAWEEGARYFDTAPWYGVGRSERRLGLGLSGLEAKREDYFVNTKVGRFLEPERVRDQSLRTLLPSGGVRTPRDPLSGFRVSFDYSGDALVKQHRDSLQRLGTCYVDSLVIHDLDYGSASPEQIEKGLHELSDNGGGGARALKSLRDSGAIRAVGVGCNMTRDVQGGQGNIRSWPTGQHEDLMERIADTVDLDFLVMAGGYTLLETSAMRRLAPLCERRGIGWVIATPFSGGMLATGPVPGASYMYAEPPPEITERAGRMQAICERHGVPLAAAALQFPLAHPLAACAIPGARSAEEARANAAHARTHVPDDVWRLFKEEALLPSDVPTPSSAPRSAL